MAATYAEDVTVNKIVEEQNVHATGAILKDMLKSLLK
jgi:hypothetical protein